MERLRPYSHYIVMILLDKTQAYKMFHFKSLKVGKYQLRSLNYNGYKYHVDPDYLRNLHGWCPWLKVNPWNPWRMVWNWVYQWYYATGFLEFHEPRDKPPGSIVEPIGSSSTSSEKWTPPVVRAVALSNLYQRYDNRLAYGKFQFTWKVALVLSIAFIIILLIATGRV